LRPPLRARVMGVRSAETTTTSSGDLEEIWRPNAKERGRGDGGRGGAGQRKTRGGLLTRTSSRVEDASRVTDRGGATPSRDDGSENRVWVRGGGTRSRPERAAGTHRAAVRAAGGEVRVERRDASGRGAGHDSRACRSGGAARRFVRITTRDCASGKKRALRRFRVFGFWHLDTHLRATRRAVLGARANGYVFG
jgi:hypothetical protein